MRTALPLIALSLAACGRPDPAPEPMAAAAAPTPTATSAPASAATPGPSATTAALTAEGCGPLRIGMTRAAVEAAMGGLADPEAAGGAETEACDQFRPARALAGLLAMVEGGRLTRLSLVRGAAVATDRGLRLGAPAAQVRAAYGPALKAESHKYAPAPAQYLTYWAEGGGGEYVQDPAARGVRYEIGADGRVEAIHAGGPSIQYVEGCS